VVPLNREDSLSEKGSSEIGRNVSGLKKRQLIVSGECKEAMMGYLKCLKLNGGNNGECRLESKKYLECRMDQ
jgi:hypothetical protein